MTNEVVAEPPATIGVFWDMEDCPIPNGLNAVQVSNNIELALANAGYDGIVSITALVDETSQIQEDGFETAGIKLIRVPEDEFRGLPFTRPRGKSDSRNWALLRQLLRWALRNGGDTTVLIIDDTSFFDPGQYNSNSCNVLVSQLQMPSRQLVTGATRIWLWTSLAQGGEPIDRSFLGIDFCEVCGVPVTPTGELDTAHGSP